MGTVYLAEQVTIGRKVVVKILNQRLSQDPTAVERFRREARAIARLSHPNLIQVYLFGTTEEGAPYIAMEFVPGRPLSEALLIAGRIPQKQALRIAVQIFDAVAHAHATGVIHRDLKPPNIMLCEVTGQTDFVKVLDFGLAKLVGEARPDATLTKTGCITGTPRYMSPEQARGDALDARSDIYSLGIILYEMLAGAHPFEAATISDYLVCHMSWPPRLFAVSAPGLTLDEELQAFVLRCLAKSPDERPPTADAAAAELRRILDRLPAGETTASLSDIAQMPTADGTADGGLPAAPIPVGGFKGPSGFTGSPPKKSGDFGTDPTVALPSEPGAPRGAPQGTKPGSAPSTGSASSPSSGSRSTPSTGSASSSPADSRTAPFARPGNRSWRKAAIVAWLAVLLVAALWLSLTWVLNRTAEAPQKQAEPPSSSSGQNQPTSSVGSPAALPGAAEPAEPAEPAEHAEPSAEDYSTPKPDREIRFGFHPYPGALESHADEESVYYEIHADAQVAPALRHVNHTGSRAAIVRSVRGQPLR
jgi:serine/threonine-protein kinase